VHQEADHKVLTQLWKQERDSGAFLFPQKMFELIHMVTAFVEGQENNLLANTQIVRIAHMFNVKNIK
jgi:hypothetical protein